MGVKYEGGGSPVVRTFTDSLQVGVTSYGLGDSWSAGPGLLVPSTNDMSTLQNYLRTAAGAFFQAASVLQNNGTPWVFTPRTVINSIRSSQYVEAQFFANDSAQGVGVLVCGIFALSAISSNAWRAYSLTWGNSDANPNNNNWQVHRCLNVNGYTSLLAGGVGSCVNTDTMGLSVEVTGSQNNLRIWRNGSLAGSVSDANAARPLFGNPGIGRIFWASGAGPGTRTNQFRNFFCRVGTR